MPDIRALILTHGDLAAELARVAEMIMGPVDGLATLSNRDCSAPRLQEAVRRHLDAARGDGAEGVLILVDDYAGSCATATRLAVLEDEAVRIICGVNLAMVLGFASWRDSLELEDLTQRVLEKGRESITRVGGA